VIRSLGMMPGWERFKRIAVPVFLALVALALGLAMGYLLVSPSASNVMTFVGVAFCLGAVLVDPKLGLLLWVIISPYARFVPLDIVLGRSIPDLKLDRVITLVLAMLWAAQVAVGRRKGARVYWSDVFFAAFALFTLVSYSGSPFTLSKAVQNYWDVWLVPVLAYLMARQLFRSEQDMKRVGVTLGIIGVYMGLLATHEQLTGVILFYPENRSVIYTTHIRRVVNLLGNPATLAACLSIAAPFAARGMVEAVTRWRRLVWVGVLLIMGMGSLMCYNRSGWLGFVLSLLVMIPFYPRFRKVFLPVFLVAGVALLAAWGIVSATPAVRERLEAQGPIVGRIESYTAALRMAAAHPILGVGQGNYGKYYSLYARGVESQYFDPNRRVTASPHNSLLYVLANGGLVTFLPYIGFILSSFFITFKFYRRVKERTGRARGLIVASWGAMVGYLIPCMGADLVAIPYLSVLCFLVVGAVQGWIFGDGQALVAPEAQA